MAPPRILVVNADDFGQSPGVNRGIIESYERGIVTSASLMVRWPAAAEAAEYAREHPGLALGLHCDLCEWAYRDGGWAPVYEVVRLDDAEAVADELARQLLAFERQVGGPPTHLDSHQHVHRDEPVRSVLLGAARERGIPLRHFSPGVRYLGAFYGQTGTGSPLPGGIGVDALRALIEALPSGITELGCHPGLGEDLESMYRVERAEEVRTLIDPRIRATIIAQGVDLRSFRDIAGFDPNKTRSLDGG